MKQPTNQQRHYMTKSQERSISRNDGMPITEEMLVEFIMEHGVTCAEDLDDLSHLIHLIRAEADTPCMAMWDEEVTVH